MKKSTETYSPWKPAKPDATMGALAGTLGTLLRTPFEALAARVYTALAVSYPDVREAHGAVFRHLPLAGASVSDLARRAGMAKQSMGFLVDSLLGAGYLEAAQSATDRRAKHPRFNMHFTPTSASWLNMVERFFRDISENRLRRGVFTSVPELVSAIDEYIAHHNTNPKPFIWTKNARDILQKVIRANSRLSSKQNATLH
ncbi:hypothetical protein RLDS_11260 [Sphingobium lactosutens DS20]|uniref:HTH marR-type domain-containing protein n=1 Tax=Sphingobium lactosutens DS20 TaxID=1331060 RepID=T0HGK2_9SPHN|nr:hypothetical protein RLDS_11260 [Sphingobium lactosutens DS20]